MTIKKIWINFFAGVTFLFFAVWLFTKPSFINGFNLSGKGEIGDVIGGITTPIISLAGAILIFLSFKEQVTATLSFGCTEYSNFFHQLFFKTCQHFGITQIVGNPYQ